MQGDTAGALNCLQSGAICTRLQAVRYEVCTVGCNLHPTPHGSQGGPRHEPRTVGGNLPPTPHVELLQQRLLLLFRSHMQEAAMGDAAAGDVELPQILEPMPHIAQEESLVSQREPLDAGVAPSAVQAQELYGLLVRQP